MPLELDSAASADPRHALAEQQTNTATPEDLYRTLVERWNERDAAGFARLFESEGHSIGFDGSEMHGPEEIESALPRSARARS